MSIFRKHPPKTTYLECHGYNGCIYRVVGMTSGNEVRYRVEVERGAQCFVLTELSGLSDAQRIALWLLDNGAVPEQFRQKTAEVLREQPCI